MQNSNLERPFFLSLINLIAIAYFSVYWILFMISIFSNNLITKTLNHYSEIEFSSKETYLFSIIGIILYTILLYTLLEIRKLKKRGFLIFACILIINSSLATYFLTFDWISMCINLFFLFTLSIYIKRYH